jgi:hypothetical protein
MQYTTLVFNGQGGRNDKRGVKIHTPPSSDPITLIAAPILAPIPS